MLTESTAKGGPRNTITRRCEEHTDELVEIYCRTHDVVCCRVCLTLKHNSCKNVEYIPKVAAGFSRTKDISKLKSDLNKIKKELRRIESSRQKNQTRIQHKKDHVMTLIKDSRQRINAIFDALEKSVTDEAQQQQHDYGGRIQSYLDELDDAIKKMEAVMKEFDDEDTQNEAQLFVDVKNGAENLGEFRQLVEQIQELLGKEMMTFNIDAIIEGYVERLDTFVDELRGAGKLQTGVRRENAMVKMHDDRETCDIQGSCCLPDGGTLLSDYSNNKLKRVDTSYRVTDSCSIKHPLGVCYIPHTNEAAICQEDGQVHIVSVGRTMTITSSIKTHDTCYGVSYNNGQLYVGQYNDKVHVYDFASGDHKSTIHTDEHGQHISSISINHIAVNPDGTSIWVADDTKGLIQLDISGNILRTIAGDEMAGAVGVCLGKDNSVIVCGFNPCNVLQLSPDGEISTLVRTDDLPADPTSICYDAKRARLLVTMRHCDHLNVFHIK